MISTMSAAFKANTGGFVWGKGKWKFMQKADFPTTADGWNMGFCQMLIVKDGNVRPMGAKMRNNVNIYRALCEKDGKLCIAESKKKMTYETFVKSLSFFLVFPTFSVKKWFQISFV